ncbi:MAG: hypothetical protein RLY31_827 [Bacteroidota bacterium]
MKTNDLLRFTRYYEWWDYKLGIFLGIGLLVLLHSETPDLAGALAHLGMLLLSIVVGAVFVSLINDFFDLEDDRRSGKHNRQQHWPRWKSLLLIGLSLAGGAGFLYYFRDSLPTALAYLPPWIAFTLYSAPPFRFKERGILGSLADASGAHLFPTLFLLTGMYTYGGSLPPGPLLVSFAVWSFSFGFRSIACHQFSDLEHDRQGGIHTFAVLLSDPRRLRRLAVLAVSAELGAFAFALLSLRQYPLLILLGTYLFLAWLLRTYRSVDFVVIVKPDHSRWRLLMTSFYQTVLPVVLLAQLALAAPRTAWLLPVFLVLFLRDIRTIRYDLLELYDLGKRTVFNLIR